MSSTKNPRTGLTALAVTCLTLMLFVPAAKAQTPAAAPATAPPQPVRPEFMTGRGPAALCSAIPGASARNLPMSGYPSAFRTPTRRSAMSPVASRRERPMTG